MRRKNKPAIPSVEEFKRTLLSIEASLPQSHREMLLANYHAPNRTITTTQLAKAVGYKTYGGATLQYGKRGHRLCELLEYQPTMTMGNGDLVWASVVADAPLTRSTDEWEWTLRPEVAQAMEEIGWVEKVEWKKTSKASHDPVEGSSPTAKVIAALLTDPQVRAEEVQLAAMEGRHYIAEGGFRRRNRALIEAKKRQSDGKCSVCGFDFRERYEGIEKDHLVAHHVKPIGKRKRASKTTLDQIDLLCPNCQAAVHSEDPPLSADELRRRLISPA